MPSMNNKTKNSSSNRKRIINRIMICVALGLLFFIIILMNETRHKNIVYIFTFLVNATILYCVFENYVDIRKLGLGKTRKTLHKEIKMDYLKMIVFTLLFVLAIVLFDYIIYGSVLLYNKVIFIYLLSLCIFTIPMNYLVNSNQAHWYRILNGTLNLIGIGTAIYLYQKDSLFYISYIVLGVQITMLFLLRNKGFLKKDL